MAMGMTYDEFWHGPPGLVRFYRKAWEIKQHNEEAARWRQGLYIYTALRCAPLVVGFPKDTKAKAGQYPDQPFPLNEEEADEQQRQRDEANFKEYLAQMEAESKRNLERMKKEANENG